MDPKPRQQKRQDDPYSQPPRGGRGRGGQDRPQTTRGGRGQRQEGGGRGKRPNTGYDKGDEHQHRPNNRPPLDQNSWQWKFKHGERPVYADDVKVTLDTKIPELPKETIKKPSRDEFDKTMRELDNEASQLKLDAEELRYKRRQVFEGGRVTDDPEVRIIMKEKFDEVRKFREQRNEHHQAVDKLKAELEVLENEKQEYQQNIPRNYHTEADLKDAIKQKKKTYENSNMSSTDEKRLLKEIEALKRAMPDMLKLKEIMPKVQKIRDEIKKHRDEIGNYRKIIEDREDKISDAKKASQAKQSRKEEVREQADRITEQIDKTSEKITAVYKKKDEFRENYFKQLYLSEVQVDEVRHIRRLMAQQKRLREAKDDKQERIQKKKAEIQERTHPFIKEIETCEHLIAYCNKLRSQFGLVGPSSEEVAKKVEKEMIHEYNQADIQQKLKDGRLMEAHTKDEGVTVIGGGKGKKGKKNKGQQQKAESASTSNFNIDFAAINKFGQIRVSPPTGPEQLESKIEEIKKASIKFQKDGEAELKKEKQDMLDHLEEDVEEEIAAEALAAQEEEYGQEEEKKEEPYYKQPKRAERTKRRQPKGEFEGSDDEEPSSLVDNAYARPSRGGGQPAGKRGGRGGKKAAFDADDFPSL